MWRPFLSFKSLNIWTSLRLSMSHALFFRISATRVRACARVLSPPHKFENFIVAPSTYLSSSWRLPTKTLLVKFRKSLSMFRGRTVTSKFWQFQKKNVLFILNVFGLAYKLNLGSLLIISTVFGSRCLVHSQHKNFLNQSYQKLLYRSTATSIINTKLLHIFLI